MKQIFIISTLFLTLVSCDKYKDEEVTPLLPGSFGITLISETNPNGKVNSNGRISQTSETTFDLGPIKASSEFGFLLTNQGEELIFDITITSSNPSFAISPSSILELQPLNFVNLDEESNQGFIPIVSLDITHGNRINGIGFIEPLPAGFNDAIISFEGKTLNDSDTINLSLDFEISVSALVMDVELKSNGAVVDLTSPSGLSTTTLGDLGWIRTYNVGSNLEIENTGNVQIMLTIGSTLIKLNPSEIHTFNSTGIIQLDGDGTITNHERIQLGTDGVGYFKLN
ncbi:MAG: hypothetical protein OCD76_06805 [Reichenbachiella sp.]